MTKEKATRLNKEHDGENNTNGSSRLGIELTDEIGIGNIVKARHHHRNNGWNRHFYDHVADRPLGQKLVIILFFLHLNHKGTKKETDRTKRSFNLN